MSEGPFFKDPEEEAHLDSELRRARSWLDGHGDQTQHLSQVPSFVMTSMEFFSEVSAYGYRVPGEEEPIGMAHACIMAAREGDKGAAEIERILGRLAIRAGEAASLTGEADPDLAKQQFQCHVEEAVRLLATWYASRHPGLTGPPDPHGPRRRIETVEEGADLLREFLPLLPEEPPAEETAEHQADILAALREGHGFTLTSTIPIADLQGLKKFAERAGNQKFPGLDMLVLKALHFVHADTVTLTPLKTQDGEPVQDPIPVEAKPVTGTVRVTEDLTLNVTFWADTSGLVFFLGQEPCGLGLASPTAGPWQEFADALNARNRRLELPCPFEPVVSLPAAPQALKAPDFPLQTSQEWEAMQRAASDGRTGANWTSNPQGLTRTHHVPDFHHQVRLELTEQEKADGLGINALERLTDKQDADGVFALLYVSRVLVPPSPLPANAYAGGWIDIDDVAAKIWPAPRSAKEREENRARAYGYLLFGARAHVVGKRSTAYFNRNGEEIPTEIDGPIWTFMDKERPRDVSLSFWPSAEVPLRQEIVCSRDWTRLTTSADTCQYLPLGEVLGAIPGNKAAGAWARVLGLALANFWRRKPREALDGTLWPTRHELLTHYTPKTAEPLKILKSDTPHRALTFWHDALGILCERQFLAREGEADRTVADMKAGLSRYGWQAQWLDERVDLRPGPEMRPAVEASANALPFYKPRVLTPKKKGGRPRKRRSEVVE